MGNFVLLVVGTICEEVILVWRELCHAAGDMRDMNDEGADVLQGKVRFVCV